MGKSINTSEATHDGISSLAFRLKSDGIRTNIGDVTDHLWEFVKKRHPDEFKIYIHETVRCSKW